MNTVLTLNHIQSMKLVLNCVKKNFSFFQKNLAQLLAAQGADNSNWNPEQKLGKVQLPSTYRQSGSVARGSPGLQPPAAHAPAILPHGRGGQTVKEVAHKDSD